MELQINTKYSKLFLLLNILLFVFLTSNNSISVTSKLNDEELQIIGFSENILLSTNDVTYGHHVEPTIAIDEDDRLYAGWKNAADSMTGGLAVSFSRSDNNGKAWTTPYDMPMFDNIFTGQSDPWLVYYDGAIYYAYLEYSRSITSDLSQITVAKSTNQGDTWQIVTATEGEGFADKETMTIAKNGIIYVTYDDIYDNGSVVVRLSKSIDTGNTFHEYGVIADSIQEPIDHLGPYVTTDNFGNVFVAWTRFTDGNWGDVYLTKSLNGGATFTSGIDINSETENATFTTSYGYAHIATLPVVRFDTNDRLYVLWSEMSDFDLSFGIFLRFSDDYGLTWSSKYTISPTITGDQWQPDMDIDSKGRLHISYYDQQGSTFGPYYRLASFANYSSTDIILSKAIPIATENTSVVFTRPGDYFTIRVDSHDIPHVVWTDGRNNEMDIYYSHGIIAKNSKALVIGLSVGIPVGAAIVGISIAFIVKRRK
ncbi:MAG TPA: sialidase family protein [Candidatus Bathyarchaeia archaeon]|nr:sialidase family protein [Candidatus Bathyarchaeia archaeon]